MPGYVFTAHPPLPAVDFDTIVLVASTGVFCLFAWWLRKRWRLSEANGRRAKAHQTLRERGMEAFPYQPAFGVEDPELRAALTIFEFSGYVILDKDDKVVGRLMPKVVGKSNDPVHGLRLVVDNTK